MYARVCPGEEAFGKTIADFQGIQWEIAKLATEIEAPPADVPGGGAGRRGKVHQGMGAVPLDAKYYATEWREGVQRVSAAARSRRVHEGPPLELYYRDAKQLTIVEGRARSSSASSHAGSSTATSGGTDGRHGLADVLERLIAGQDLTRAEAAAAMGSIMAGDTTPSTDQRLPRRLRTKGASHEELCGLLAACSTPPSRCRSRAT